MVAKWQQWMPFRIDAFRGSPAVQAMHPCARIGYLYLLADSWQTDDCTIPTDPLDLAERSGLGDELWAIHGLRILRKFDTVTVRSPLDNSTVTVERLQNAVCFQEWKEAKRVFDLRRASADRTNEVRSPHGHRNGELSGPSRSADTQTTVVPVPVPVPVDVPVHLEGKDSFQLPDWIDTDTWDGFEEMRRKERHPLTDRARQNIVNSLARFKELGDDPDIVLNRSITNGWRAVWPLDRDSKPPQVGIDTPERRERQDTFNKQQEEEGYAMWLSMPAEYRSQHPWKKEGASGN